MATKYVPNPRMLSPAAKARQDNVGVERHTVEEIDYHPDIDKMSCSCGEWEGPALDLAPFKAHRRAMGRRPR